MERASCFMPLEEVHKPEAAINTLALQQLKQCSKDLERML